MTRIVFMGTPDFSVPVLETLLKEGYHVVGVVTQPDRPVGRKRLLMPTPVKAKALEWEIPVFQPEKIKTDHQQVLDWQPDLIITAAFGQIIPKVLLDAPKHGCINVHASLLPDFRGGAPIHKAIMEGKTETGVTIMYMDVSMDTGDMISKVVEPIGPDDHTGLLFKRLSTAGAALLSRTLPGFLAGKIQAEPQDHEAATFAWNIKREDEKIHWDRPAQQIYDQIRGLHPWPVAFTELDGLAVKVWWGHPVPGSFSQEAGTIAALEKDGIIVVCGDGAGIKLTDLQLAGKKRLDARSILNGSHPFETGKKFN